MDKRTEISDVDEDVLFLTEDFYDEALVGYAQGCGRETVAVYDMQVCIQVLIEEGATEEEAMEHFDYNVMGSYVGQRTPIFITFV